MTQWSNSRRKRSIGS